MIAGEIGHVNQEDLDPLIGEYEHVSHMLAKIIKARGK